MDNIKQELEMANAEVAELNRKLIITHEEKEDLNSKYLAALSKIEEVDKINMDLKTDANATGIQILELLAEKNELNKRVGILTAEIENAQQKIADKEREIADGRRKLENDLQVVMVACCFWKQELEHTQGTVAAVEKTLAEKEAEISTLQEKLHEKENEASGQIIVSTAQFNNMQNDLLSLQKTKEELELDCVKLREEHAESLKMVESEKNELASTTVDLQRTLEERDDAYQKLNEEYKQNDSWFKECKVKLEVAEKKIEEMVEEFHEGIELKDQMVADLEHTVEDLKRDLEKKGDEISTLLGNVRMIDVKLRLSNQKLQVTEQLPSEKEESFRKTEEKSQQEQRELGDRIAISSAIIAANSEAFHEIITKVKECVNSVMNGIETVSRKFSDDYKNYENCISNVSHELQVAGNCVKEMNKEKEQLKKDKHYLLEQMRDKNEQELALREMIEKLEAKASKEGLEKMNLTTTVVQLKKTVGELEKMMKEKEDGMLS